MEVHPEDDAPFEPPTRREALVPAFAVAAVAVVAVTAAVMVKRGEADNPQPVVAQQATAPLRDVPVVQAPPLNAPDTKSMGGAAACATCGVVQMVVAVRDRGAKEPRAFQMHVRMDDGSVRTVEQRGALAAGSRVVVDGNAVRPVS